jgi:hypothetical protein
MISSSHESSWGKAAHPAGRAGLSSLIRIYNILNCKEVIKRVLEERLKLNIKEVRNIKLWHPSVINENYIKK